MTTEDDLVDYRYLTTPHSPRGAASVSRNGPFRIGHKLQVKCVWIVEHIVCDSVINVVTV